VVTDRLIGQAVVFMPNRVDVATGLADIVLGSDCFCKTIQNLWICDRFLTKGKLW